jgi:5S rRNA maturation endonuclease (ribonuclease M5)
MSPLTNLIVTELNKLPPQRGLGFKGGKHWIRCPFHGGGHESTPSLRIDTAKDDRVPGSWVCFACGAGTRTGKIEPGWPSLADKLGLRAFRDKQFVELTPHFSFSDDEEADLLGQEDVVVDSQPWPSAQKWRTISGKVVARVGGKVIFVRHEPELYLPVTINSEEVGGIKCALFPRKGVPNYFNTPGTWAKKRGLYPYDYVRKRIRKNNGILTLTEGPRDALNHIQFGLLSLMIFGSGNAWSKQKAELILALEPKVICMAFDPDEAGDLAREQASADLRGWCKIVNLNLPRDENNKKLKDASDMSKKATHKLIKHLESLL